MWFLAWSPILGIVQPASFRPPSGIYSLALLAGVALMFAASQWRGTPGPRVLAGVAFAAGSALAFSQVFGYVYDIFNQAGGGAAGPRELNIALADLAGAADAIPALIAASMAWFLLRRSRD